MNKIPILGKFVGVASKGHEAQMQNINSGKVAKGLTEFFDEAVKPKSAMWSTVLPVGAAAAANIQAEPPEKNYTQMGTVRPATSNTLADQIAEAMQRGQ